VFVVDIIPDFRYM